MCPFQMRNTVNPEACLAGLPPLKALPWSTSQKSSPVGPRPVGLSTAQDTVMSTFGLNKSMGRVSGKISDSGIDSSKDIDVGIMAQ